MNLEMFLSNFTLKMFDKATKDESKQTNKFVSVLFRAAKPYCHRGGQYD